MSAAAATAWHTSTSACRGDLLLRDAIKADTKASDAFSVSETSSTSRTGSVENPSHADASARQPTDRGIEQSLIVSTSNAGAVESKRASPKIEQQGAGGQDAKPPRLSSMCFHGRQRSRCKECDGSSFCEHMRLRHYCKECGGSGICIHKRRKSDCKECRGSSICEHGKQKRQCKDCVAIYGKCEHGKTKNRCCKLCRNKPAPTHSARAKPVYYIKPDSKPIVLHVPNAIAAPSSVVAPAISFCPGQSAAAAHLDAMDQNLVLPPRLPLVSCYARELASAAPHNSMFIPPFPPVPMVMQMQQLMDFKMNLLIAQANYARLSQQRAHPLLPLHPIGAFNGMTSGFTDPGQLPAQYYGPPL